MTFSCRVCNHPLESFLDFGRMPLGNGFLRQEDFADEYFFDLAAGFCSACFMVQLLEQPPAARMFHENYPFLTGSSKWMREHFKQWAQKFIPYLNAKSFVLEIGSNDGTLLENFQAAGIRHLGFEPAERPAEAARAKGVETQGAFFDEAAAETVLSSCGRADLILAANVMCHLSEIHSVLRGIRLLLKPDGRFIFEDPYWPEILSKTAYDQIYDEHVFYFSAASLQNLLKQHDLEITGLEKLSTHGGSMRYQVTRVGAFPIPSEVKSQLQFEQTRGILSFETHEKFRFSVERSRMELISLLKDLKSQGNRIVGYGATSKSTTVTNFAGIRQDLVDFITDTTPGKQGKFNPGTHIPVLPSEAFSAPYPDYALLFAWNHRDEILNKEREFQSLGGKWVSYVPKVEVISHAEV